MRNRCRRCGYSFGTDVPDHIIDACWECRLKESSHTYIDVAIRISALSKEPEKEGGAE